MKLFFRKYGNGPYLVILHGLYGSSDNWITIAKNLSEHFTVILPDQRNHGQSPHSRVHDYDSMRNDLYELVNDLKIKKFFLAGHSMGGKTAVSFAIKWPEMINGLLIADISPFKDELSDRTENSQHLKILETINSLDLEKIVSRSEAEKILAANITSPKTIGFILKNLRRTDDNRFEWKLNAESLLNNLERIMQKIDYNTDSGYQISGFPVIILKGEKSEYISQTDFLKIKNVFPAAELVEIQGAGHWVHADNPEQVIINLKRLKEEN